MGYATNRCYVVPSLDLVVVRLGYGPQPIGPVEIPQSQPTQYAPETPDQCVGTDPKLFS
jgi:hypothetical protein